MLDAEESTRPSASTCMLDVSTRSRAGSPARAGTAAPWGRWPLPVERATAPPGGPDPTRATIPPAPPVASAARKRSTKSPTAASRAAARPDAGAASGSRAPVPAGASLQRAQRGAEAGALGRREEPPHRPVDDLREPRERAASGALNPMIEQAPGGDTQDWHVRWPPATVQRQAPRGVRRARRIMPRPSPCGQLGRRWRTARRVRRASPARPQRRCRTGERVSSGMATATVFASSGNGAHGSAGGVPGAMDAPASSPDQSRTGGPCGECLPDGLGGVAGGEGEADAGEQLADEAADLEEPQRNVGSWPAPGREASLAAPPSSRR